MVSLCEDNCWGDVPLWWCQVNDIDRAWLGNALWLWLALLEGSQDGEWQQALTALQMMLQLRVQANATWRGRNRTPGINTGITCAVKTTTQHSLQQGCLVAVSILSGSLHRRRWTKILFRQCEIAEPMFCRGFSFVRQLNISPFSALLCNYVIVSRPAKSHSWRATAIS